MKVENFLKDLTGLDAEIQDNDKNIILRGPIKKVAIENNIISIKFDFLAQNNGVPGCPKKSWIKAKKKSYTSSVISPKSIFKVNNTMTVHSHLSDQLIIFHPKKSKLDPSKVKGLKA